MYPKEPVVIALRPITVLRLSRNSRQSHKGNEVFWERKSFRKGFQRVTRLQNRAVENYIGVGTVPSDPVQPFRGVEIGLVNLSALLRTYIESGGCWLSSAAR
jgi:hypothetical protein